MAKLPGVVIVPSSIGNVTCVDRWLFAEAFRTLRMGGVLG
jgi:hypothetical protein